MYIKMNPNKETQKPLKDVLQEAETFESVDAFWNAMRMNPHAD